MSVPGEHSIEHPASTQLYEVMKDKYTRTMDALVKELASHVTPADRGDFLLEAEKVTSSPDTPLIFSKNSVPIQLDEADSAIFQDINATGPWEEGSWVKVCLDLFSDGSPYMLPEEFETYTEPYASSYFVYASPRLDRRPFIVSVNALEGHDNDDGDIPETYLAFCEETGQQPRYLTDVEAASIGQAISQAKVSVALSQSNFPYF